MEEMTILDMQRQMSAGALTAQRLVQSYLDRIETFDKHGPAINAVIEVNPDALAIAAVLDKERAIYRAQVEETKKPANIIDKIVEGKLGSYYKQFVLTDQESVRDSKMTVKDVIAAASKALGTPVTVSRFARLRVGETAQ